MEIVIGPPGQNGQIESASPQIVDQDYLPYFAACTRKGQCSRHWFRHQFDSGEAGKFGSGLDNLSLFDVEDRWVSDHGARHDFVKEPGFGVVLQLAQDSSHYIHRSYQTPMR